MNNNELAQVFENITSLLEIKGEERYRVAAYRKAAEALRSLTQEARILSEAGHLLRIPGIGKTLAAKIEELLASGRLEFYDRLTEEIPVSLLEVLRIEGVGPKRAALFWKELDIANLDQLEKAARTGRLSQLPGIGPRSEASILAGIQSFRRRQTDRVSIGLAWPAAQRLLFQVREAPGVVAAEMAGSLRRGRETIGDIDLLAAAVESGPVIEAFVNLPEVTRVKGRGDTKASVELSGGMPAQLWVHPPAHFGSALQYATGSQAHNVRLRELALKQGLSLSEHGLKGANGESIPCETEEQVYLALGLQWIAPEMREDRGEIQAAQEGRLPNLIELGHLRGELHAHSDWSDGAYTIEQMAEAAAAAGLEYLAITDHSRSLGIANGLSLERLKSQAEEIATVQAKIGDRLLLLHGTEVEILADGRLDYPDEVLAGLDLVVASVHTSQRQSAEVITQRLLGAVQNPHVDMVGHLSGRLIGSRDPSEVDVEAVLQAAAMHGKVLEINAHHERLDLNEVHARRAIELGCMLSINSDAHRPEHFEERRYGVGIARRAWVEPGSVLNSMPADQVLAWLGARSTTT